MSVDSAISLPARKGYKEEDPLLFSPQRTSSRTLIAIVAVLSLAVTCGIGVLIGYNIAGSAPNSSLPTLSTLQDRLTLFNSLKQASKSAGYASPKASDLVVNPNNYRKYVNGQNRRPTDPATAQEVSAALSLLFGPQGNVSTLASADALSLNPEGWAAVNGRLPAEFQLYPEGMVQVNAIPGKAFPLTQAQSLFLAQLQILGGDLKATHAWLRANDTVRTSLTWGSIVSTTTHVADRDEAIKVDEDLDQGLVPNFKRRVAVKVIGGISDFHANTGDLFGVELIISIDVTDVKHAFVDANYLEHYSRGSGNINIPDFAQPSDADQAYLQLAAMAIYGTKNSEGQTRAFVPYCNGYVLNTVCAVRTPGSNVKYFVKPFEWLEGAPASVYGGTVNETVMSMSLQEYSPSLWSLDGQQVSVGTFFGPSPFTLLYTTPLKRVDPQNTLQLSTSVALAWYGRGLYFDNTDSLALFGAIDWTDPLGKSNFTLIAELISRAIQNAWKNDTLLNGDQPGVLTTRASDGVAVPAVTLKFAMDTPTYVNHATPKPAEAALKKHRDVRDNPPNARPLLTPQGLPDIKPNGKHFDSIALGGPSFDVDGYGVTWDVGLIWRFNIGFDSDGGITLYNIRLQLPPTVTFPEGEMVPYLWRLNIPNFGTSYANSNAGNLYTASFLESHFATITDVVPNVNCRGSFLTLPLYISQQASTVDFNAQFVYTTYGLDGFLDPYAKTVLGKDLPMNIFPIDRGLTRSGFINHGICIQEVDEGNSMWHTYTAQRLRSLQVFGTSISEAYNVVNHFDLLSDGKIRVAERLHGKPAQMSHGLNGVGGAYGSEGRGGFAANHLHWHVVAMEPHIRKNIAGVKNSLKFTDLLRNSIQEDPLDWYGSAQHWITVPIVNSSLSTANDFDFARQRGWLMNAEDKDGKSLGGLHICSQAFGPPFTHPGQLPGRYAETSLPPEKTSLNQWWLQHDVFVSNSNWTRAKQVLLSPSETSACSLLGATSRCVNEEILGPSPVVYAVMRKYHHVTSDQLPVQNGFTNVEMTVSPMNLFPFNPNILSRYDPAYAAVYQNIPGQNSIYDPPYTTEYEL